MSQWVLIVALSVVGVVVFTWPRFDTRAEPSHRSTVALRRWIVRVRAHLPGAQPVDGGGGLAALTRRILDGVVAQGDRTLRDRAIILPHEVVVHASPVDAELLNRHRGVIEGDVSDEIVAAGERERWVSAGRLRIVEIIDDRDIAPGRPLVQRAPNRPAPSPHRGTLPFPPDPSWPPAGRYELAADAGDALPVPVDGGRIGRDPATCAMVVPAATVSREHADLVPAPDGFIVRDLDSVNGITVNGRRTDRAALRPGDVLGLGRKVRLELRRHPDLGPDDRRAW